MFAGARVLHVATVALLFVAGLGLAVGAWYWLGVIAVAALLAYEHALVAARATCAGSTRRSSR